MTVEGDDNEIHNEGREKANGDSDDLLTIQWRNMTNDTNDDIVVIWPVIRNDILIMTKMTIIILWRKRNEWREIMKRRN